MSDKDKAAKTKTQPANSQNAGRKAAGSSRYRLEAAPVEDGGEQAVSVDAKARAQEKIEKKALEAAARQVAIKENALMEAARLEDNVRGLWKSRVLASYKGRNPKDSHTLLQRVHPSGRAALQVSEHYKAAAVQEAMIATVDHMFDLLQNCAYEFNKFAQGTELELNWIRPFVAKEGSISWHSNDNKMTLVFSGRMSTRRWTMVVKGTLLSVQIFILPADKLIGFALSNQNFKPYFQMEPFCDGLDVDWRIDDYEIESDNFPIITKEIFNALIRHAKDEAAENESFDLRAAGILPPEPPEDPAVTLERQRYYQAQFLEDIKEVSVVGVNSPDVNIKTGACAAKEPTGVSLAPNTVAQSTSPSSQPTQFRKSRTNMAALKTESGASPKSNDGDSWKRLPQGRSEKDGLNLEQQRSLQRMADQAGLTKTDSNAGATSEMKGGAQTESALGQSAAAKNSEQVLGATRLPASGMVPGPMNLPAALGMLITALDRELQVIAKAGSEAFAAGDIARADAAVKFSGRLGEYRKLSQELLDYYRRKR